MRVIVSRIDTVLYDGEAKELLVSAIDGDLTILPHHSPLVTVLRKGKVTVRAADGARDWHADDGILEVSQDKATVLI